MARLLLTLIIVVALGAAGLWGYGRFKPEAVSELDSIPTALARKMPFEVRLYSLGAVSAASSRQVMAPYEGKVLKVIPEGTYVEMGEPVVWMDTQEYEDDLKDVQVEYDLALNDLEQEKGNHALLLEQLKLEEASLLARLDFNERKLADAKLQYENTLKLVEQSLAPESQREDRRLAMLQSDLNLRESKIELEKFQKTRQSQIDISLSKIEKATVMVEKYKNNLEDTKRDITNAVLVAPGPGYVSYMTFRMGGNYGKVSEGVMVYQRTPLVEIPDSTDMLARTPVNEIDIAKIQVGQRAEIRVQAFPNKKYSGIVKTKSAVPVSDSSFRAMMFGSSSSIKEFEVTIEMTDEDANLRQNMTATIEIIIEEPTEKLAIPQEAVFDLGGENAVFVKNGGAIETRLVKLGSANMNFVEVAEGLSEGDEVFLRNPHKAIEKIGAMDNLG